MFATYALAAVYFTLSAGVMLGWIPPLDPQSLSAMALGAMGIALLAIIE